eukprot:377734-Pyramimonas_sp.AAC.1
MSGSSRTWTTTASRPTAPMRKFSAIFLAHQRPSSSRSATTSRPLCILIRCALLPAAPCWPGRSRTSWGGWRGRRRTVSHRPARI